MRYLTLISIFLTIVSFIICIGLFQKLDEAKRENQLLHIELQNDRNGMKNTKTTLMDATGNGTIYSQKERKSIIGESTQFNVSIKDEKSAINDDNISQEEIEERNRKKTERTKKVIENIIQTEKRDPIWAADSFTEFQRFLAEDKYLKGTNIREVECVQTICRSVFDHENEDARRFFLEKSMFLSTLGSNQFGTAVKEGIGYKTIIYYTKKGGMLPHIAEEDVAGEK